MSLESFKYCGKKTKLLPLYRPIPSRSTVAVEPYLGSGAFLLNTTLPGIGIEYNKDLFDCWKWLQQTTPQALRELNQQVKEHRKSKSKFDVRDMKLEKGPETYVRVNITGLVTGQLSSWGVYPQHNLPVEKTILALPRIRQLTIIYGKAEDWTEYKTNHIVFLDPPYVGTQANYIQKKTTNKNFDYAYDPQTTIALISKLSCPIIFTYGTNAKEIFPDYKWETVLIKKVPNMRRGGTVDRIEYVSYINFPKESERFTLE